MMKTLVPLILLIGAVILSGCTTSGGGTTATGNGIVIQDFSFDYTPIYSGDQIGLNIELQNIGGEIGTLKKVTVFGQDFTTSADPLKWSISNTGELTQILTSPEGDLYPPDSTTGFEGDIWTYQWLITAPNDVKAPTDYEFQVRSEYSYTTEYSGTIRIVSANYLRTLSATDRENLIKEGGVVSSSVTAGPLNLAAASGRHFIVQSGAGATTSSVKFKVTNVGSGYPYNAVLTDPASLYLVRITGTDGLSCTKTDFLLARGKTGTFSCDIDIPAEGSITNKLDKNFRITLSYDYFVDSAASITVQPTFT
jgi:hypothetical protein